MVNQIFVYESDTYCPYSNLAMEEYFLYCIPDNACLLYLWQNNNTVVIGQNQNPFAQCDMNVLRQRQIKIARRLSGGGAVYHDKGNLNYTFIAKKNNYSVSKNLDIVISALQNFGIEAVKGGRNDIEFQQKKISGNAFYNKGDYCYHHGTLLINSNLDMMQQVLKVDTKKWQNKGIDSVRRRVENISSWNKNIIVQDVKEQLKKSFKRAYSDAAEKEIFDIEKKETELLKEKYASCEWIWGKEVPCTLMLQERYFWGDVSIHLDIEGGEIRNAKLFSDSLEVDIFSQIAGLLKARKLTKEGLKPVVKEIADKENSVIVHDVMTLIMNNI